MAAARSRSPETTGGDREASILMLRPTSHTDIDVYRAAIVLVREYGAELAPTMAAKRAHLLFAKGDRLGCIVWRGSECGAGGDQDRTQGQRACELSLAMVYRLRRSEGGDARSG